MLVLSRSINETIHIGESIEIVVVRTGDKVRLGIKAPPEIGIVRGELLPTEGEQSVASSAEAQPLPAA